jgi:hypothetical protein
VPPDAGSATRLVVDTGTALGAPTRSLICFDIVRNACSTFVEALADVSMKGIPRLSANSYIRKGDVKMK